MAISKLDTANLPQCWTLPDGRYLLSDLSRSWPLRCPARIQLPDGRFIDSATAFYLVTNSGEVVRTYPAPQAYSLEDTLYIYDLHIVSDGALCNYLWQQPWRGEEMIELQEIVLSGLVECDPATLPFDVESLREGVTLYGRDSSRP